MKKMAHLSFPSCGITVTLTLTVCINYLKDVIVFPCVFNAMSTLFIKLWDNFNLHTCVVPGVLRILSVALGGKGLCTTVVYL